MQTLPEYLTHNPHMIAVLGYMDLDQYAPTKFVLEQVINPLPMGTVVAFDELNYRSFPCETVALFETLANGAVPPKG